MDPVEIELPTYRVLIARGALAEIGRIVPATTRAHRYAIVADANVAPLYAARVRSALGEGRTRVYTIPAGEEHKTRTTWGSLTDSLLADGFGRDSIKIEFLRELKNFARADFVAGDGHHAVAYCANSFFSEFRFHPCNNVVRNVVIKLDVWLVLAEDLSRIEFNHLAAGFGSFINRFED
jgi:hypothetical protein